MAFVNSVSSVEKPCQPKRQWLSETFRLHLYSSTLPLPCSRTKGPRLSLRNMWTQTIPSLLALAAARGTVGKVEKKNKNVPYRVGPPGLAHATMGASTFGSNLFRLTGFHTRGNTLLYL